MSSLSFNSHYMQHKLSDGKNESLCTCPTFFLVEFLLDAKIRVENYSPEVYWYLETEA